MNVTVLWEYLSTENLEKMVLVTKNVLGALEVKFLKSACFEGRLKKLRVIFRVLDLNVSHFTNFNYIKI